MMDYRQSVKAMIRHGLASDGIDPNVLMKNPVSIGSHDNACVISRIEFQMVVFGISVEELKEGTPFEHLEEGKNIFGEDIKEGENVYGQKLDFKKKKMEEDAAAFAAFEKLWKEANPNHDPNPPDERVALAMSLLEEDYMDPNNLFVEDASVSYAY